eukprot:NODE_38_length_30618_cov_0.377142.p10 type:complete len:291 gc:universal NODE_38_length_30618_cov_0.377142:5005-5877(+)
MYEVYVVVLEMGFLTAGFAIICTSIKEIYYIQNLRLKLKVMLLSRALILSPTFACMISERFVALEKQTFTYDPSTLASTLDLNSAEEVMININSFANGMLSIWFMLTLSTLTSKRFTRLQRFFQITTCAYFFNNMLIYGGVYYAYRPMHTYLFTALEWGIIIFNDFRTLKILSTIKIDEAKRKSLVENVRSSYRAASFFYVGMGATFFFLVALNIYSVASVIVTLLWLVSSIYYKNSAKVFSYLDYVHIFINSTIKIESNTGDTEMKVYGITMPVTGQLEDSSGNTDTNK